MNGKAPLIERGAAWLAKGIVRRAGTILMVTAVLVVLAAMLASKLRIDQELRRLLPTDFPSVTRLDALSARIGHQSDLYVTIRSPSREANIAYGEALAGELATRDDVRFVQFRRDLGFFEDRALLYANLADVVDLRRKVIHRIRQDVRKRAYGDFGGDAAASGSAAPDGEASAASLGVDVDAMRETYGVRETSSEFMEADEGRLMVVKIRPLRPSTDVAFARRLSEEVLASAQALEPTAFHPEMVLGLEGAYVQHSGRVKGLQQEVVGGSLSAALALLLTLAVYFRSVRAVVVVFVPLLGSIVGALAYAWLRFDVLNLVSAFIFAVLLGLGIDHGIHVLSRYRQERMQGLEGEAAWARTLATSGWATVAGSISTAAAFASLMIADFQGFAQFGQVAAVGVVLSVVAALVVMPSFLVVLDRVRPWRPPSRPAEASHRPLGRSVRVLAIGLTCVGLVAAGLSAWRLPELTFEHDLQQLGPRRDAEPKTGRPANYRDAVGHSQTVDPIMALTERWDQVEDIQAQLSALGAMTPEEVAAFDPKSPPTRPLPPPPIDPLDDVDADEIDADNVDADNVDAGNVDGGTDIDADEDLDPEDDADDAVDTDPEVDSDDFADDDFGDEDLDDPRFVAIERLAVREAVMSDETAQLLGTYGVERLVTMKDRLNESWSLAAFVPRHQDAKLEVIRDIRRRIQDKHGMLSPSTRAEVDSWIHYLDVDAPVSVDDLPMWVRAQFQTAEPGSGGVIVISTRGSKADIHNARRIYDAFGDLRSRDGSVPTAAELYVIPEIFDTILRDGPVVVTLSLAIMVSAAWILLRRVGAALAVAVTLGLALLWLGGWMVAWGWKLNFFNIIVLPLLLGMGEDDALHLAEREVEERGDWRRVLRGAGGPIVMTTLTTVWGFSGILFANHRGLESMAWVAVTGMTFALLASVICLPVLIEGARWVRRRARRQS